MASELSVVRMASTAAWSAFFSSPRPISLEAARAAASVTRTASSARLRSILPVLVPVSAIASSVGVSLRRLKCLDPDQAGLLGHRLELCDAGECTPHRRLFRLARGHHDGPLAGLPAAALQHRF